MTHRSVLCLLALLGGCGEMVRPVAREVRFRATRADGVVLAAAMVAVRAEAEDGGSVEATTDADGACTLLLATNTRWNVTFAGAQITALSILGLRPEAVTDAIPVRLNTRDSVLQRTAVGSGGACVIPSASTVRQLRVRVRNFVIGARRDARQEAGPFACVLRVDRPAGEPANTYDVV